MKRFRITADERLWCLLGSLCLLAPMMSAQEGEASDTGIRTASVAWVSGEITIDGRLNEPAWSSAPSIGDLVQQQPDTGAPPTEHTAVFLLHDANFLYVGIMVHDREPDRLIATDMARDASLDANDSIEILLDTFRDQRNAYYFATNPVGALVDGLVYGNETLNTDWDAIWDLRTQETDTGWTAEFAIPFKSLSFPAGGDTWGFNINRNIYRKLEQARWSGARLETDFLKVAEAGEITNLSGLRQGVGLDIRPFIASRWIDNRTTGSDADLDPGLDVFYNITPSLKLTGTVNTDFGETEVDARQINLTRFSLFFPEKRSFFLEDAGVFDFVSTGPEPGGGIPKTGADVYPFFSRRIGLLHGEEVPLEFGSKLTGTVGSRDIGVLYAHTGESGPVGAKDFLVGRIKQNIFEQSYVGGIFTDGNPNPGSSGQTYGLDLHLATSRFLDRRNLVFDAYCLRGQTDGLSGDDWSYGFVATYPNDKWEGKVVYREIQENFTPGVGFVQRKNVRMFRLGGSYNPRPRDFLNIQQMFHRVYYTHFTRLDNGQVESTEFRVKPIDWHFFSGDSILSLADYYRQFERLFAPFEISPGVVLQPGDYTANRSRISLSSAAKRPLSGRLAFAWGEYWSGTAEEITASVTVKLPPWLSTSLSTSQTLAHLPEGDFIARVVTSNIDFALSPRLSFANLLQYDNRSENLGWQCRMRWTLKPGSDLFISFHQGWIRVEGDSRRFIHNETKLAGKFQYTFRF